MGSNNASKSASAYSVGNYSTILRNGIAFKLGDLDVSERQLLLELRRIILMDEILDVILECSLPKPGKISRGSRERMSTENLWSTIWGRLLLIFEMKFCTMAELRPILNHNVAFAIDFEYLSQCLQL